MLSFFDSRRMLDQAGKLLNTEYLYKYASPLSALSGVLFAWMIIVRSQRWRRYDDVHRKYGPKWDNGNGSMTPEEAQEILLVSTTYDMPLLLNYAVAFALFKTYAIPSISKLLGATRELKSTETISKRYADTEILISTILFCPISGMTNKSISNPPVQQQNISANDPRCMIALSRVNYLHSKYQISNDDYLYTLCLFILEPIAWASRWGWRKLSPLERQAYYIFWTEIGRRMGIKDIPDNLEGLETWSKEYERVYMVSAQSNHDLAGYTLDELVSAVPNRLGLKALTKRAAITTMDDRLREAMLYAKQPRHFQTLVSGLLVSISLFQRAFLLPRRSPVLAVDNGSAVNGGGGCPRLHPNKWAARPWYRPEPTGIIGGWWDQTLVSVGWHSELPGEHLKSSGYRIEELGPLKFENVGHEEVMRMAAEFQGCPISGPWSLEGKNASYYDK